MALGVPLSMGLFSNLVLAVSASRGRTLAWRVGTRDAVGQGQRRIHRALSMRACGNDLRWRYLLNLPLMIHRTERGNPIDVNTPV
ncbi:hypothetical protein GAY31_00065 [Azospirillum brasilense]|nr:hypothetical protein [Azospirillum brasilense]